MENMDDANCHDPKFRETKPLQGDAARPVADLFRLDGRTVVVTGGTGFLGVTVIQAILESGADVVCLDVLPAPKAEEWAPVEAAAKAHSRNLYYYHCDVRDEQRVKDIFAEITSEKSVLRYPIRSFLSCAGVSDLGRAETFPIDRFRRLFDINVHGTFLVAQQVSLELQRTGSSGSMAFVASMSGHVTNKGVNTAGYNASKAALHQLARSLAAEWGSRKGEGEKEKNQNSFPLIRVNTLSPGYIRTAATAEALAKPGLEEQWVGDNMLYRLSTADEFRAPVLFLLGDGSSFMTGADLRVDGGHCAW